MEMKNPFSGNIWKLGKEPPGCRKDTLMAAFNLLKFDILEINWVPQALFRISKV